MPWANPVGEQGGRVQDETVVVRARWAGSKGVLTGSERMEGGGVLLKTALVAAAAAVTITKFSAYPSSCCVVGLLLLPSYRFHECGK